MFALVFGYLQPSFPLPERIHRLGASQHEGSIPFTRLSLISNNLHRNWAPTNNANNNKSERFHGLPPLCAACFAARSTWRIERLMGNTARADSKGVGESRLMGKGIRYAEQFALVENQVFFALHVGQPLSCGVCAAQGFHRRQWRHFNRIGWLFASNKFPFDRLARVRTHPNSSLRLANHRGFAGCSSAAAS
jgi:hypothetical protein